MKWEEKTNRHKEIRQDTPTSGPQPSRGRVPFVLWKCPICPADVMSNLCGVTCKSGRDIPDVPGLAPNRPRDNSEACRPPTSFMCSLLSAAFYAAYGFTGAFGRNLCKFTFPQRRRNLRKSLLDHKTYTGVKVAKKGCVKNYASERVERKRSNAGK